MPLQINDLGKEQRTFTWHYLGEEIAVTYNIYRFTPEMEAEINAGGVAEEQASRVLVESLLSILLDWEIMDGEEKVAIEFDTLMELPTRLLADVMEAIGEDAGGDEDEGKGSGGRSRPNRASRRARSNGSTSSRQRGSFE